jgi:nitrous oxidase accessory protein NosD
VFHRDRADQAGKTKKETKTCAKSQLDVALREGRQYIAAVNQKLLFGPPTSFSGGERIVRKRSVFIAALICLMSLSAFAQATRTWVSGVGDDANPCSRTAPCKTFAGAISKTAAGGVIDALDPGGFGAVTITKAMTLEGNGTLASALHSGVNGIIINITSGTNRDVVLRNILIDGAGVTLGTNGVRFLAGDSLTVEDCYITHDSGSGIDFEPTGSAASLSVKNTSVQLTGTGIFIAPNTPGGGTATATIYNSILTRNGTGLKVQDGSRVNIFQSEVSQNVGDGIFGNGLIGLGCVLMVEACDVSNNTTGIHSNGSASTRVSASTIAGNSGSAASATNSSSLITFQNNHVTQNGSPGAFTGTDGPT